MNEKSFDIKKWQGIILLEVFMLSLRVQAYISKAFLNFLKSKRRKWVKNAIEN